MHTYTHKVQYYETDKMGITHHSNYVRWMEEARIDFLEQIGWGYDKMEQTGVVSPVLGISCDFKKSTTFNDSIQISLYISKYNGIKFSCKYIMTNINTGELVAQAESRHCLLDEQGKPFLLKRRLPELDEILYKYHKKE